MDIIDKVAILVAMVILTIIVIGYTVVRYKEKRKWNGGYCEECGQPWFRLFSTNSRGSRRYRCSNGHRCDISYNVDKKNKGVSDLR